MYAVHIFYEYINIVSTCSFVHMHLFYQNRHNLKGLEITAINEFSTLRPCGYFKTLRLNFFERRLCGGKCRYGETWCAVDKWRKHIIIGNNAERSWEN